MQVIKASGLEEKFSRAKFCASIERAGVEPFLARKVCRQLVNLLPERVSSQEVLRQTLRLLRKESQILAAKYNLKRAIMELGPSGFPFEKYIAKILEAYGFSAKTNQRVKGFCVWHEVDVIAQKDNKKYLIEAKYHNAPGLSSDVKVVLYVLARFLDIQKARENSFTHLWLITNTRWTLDAVRYAKCNGIKITGWRYPEKDSLEKIIESKGLYPITSLPALKRFARDALAKKNIIMAKDILDYSAQDFQKISGLDLKSALQVYRQAKELCRISKEDNQV